MLFSWSCSALAHLFSSWPSLVLGLFSCRLLVILELVSWEPGAVFAFGLPRTTGVALLSKASSGRRGSVIDPCWLRSPSRSCTAKGFDRAPGSGVCWAEIAWRFTSTSLVRSPGNFLIPPGAPGICKVPGAVYNRGNPSTTAEYYDG